MNPNKPKHKPGMPESENATTNGFDTTPNQKTPLSSTFDTQPASSNLIPTIFDTFLEHLTPDKD